jgi:predicted cytidylate kinase
MKQSNNDILIIIGGPGGSGSSTIAEMLSKHLKIPRIYAGDMYREKAKEEDMENFEQFLEEISGGGNSLDLEIDTMLTEYALKGNILIESKIFGAIAKTRGLLTTATIWLTADINTRARRKLENEKVTGIKRILKFFSIKSSLKRRFNIDREKYKRLYDIKYEQPSLYYDIVLDTSKLNEVETFNLILEKLNDGGYFKKQES